MKKVAVLGVALIMMGAMVIPAMAIPIWQKWAKYYQTTDYHNYMDITPVDNGNSNNGNTEDIWLPSFNESFFHSGLCTGAFVMPTNTLRDLCPWAYTYVNYPVF